MFYLFSIIEQACGLDNYWQTPRTVICFSVNSEKNFLLVSLKIYTWHAIWLDSISSRYSKETFRVGFEFHTLSTNITDLWSWWSTWLMYCSALNGYIYIYIWVTNTFDQRWQFVWTARSKFLLVYRDLVGAANKSIGDFSTWPYVHFFSHLIQMPDVKANHTCALFDNLNWRVDKTDQTFQWQSVSHVSGVLESGSVNDKNVTKANLQNADVILPHAWNSANLGLPSVTVTI